MRISDWSSDVCSSDLDPGDRVGIEHPVLDAVRDHVDAGVGRELAPLDGHRVGEDALAMLVRLVGERGERLDIHRGFLRQLAVAPAVGERDRTSTRLNSSHSCASRMTSYA